MRGSNLSLKCPIDIFFWRMWEKKGSTKILVFISNELLPDPPAMIKIPGSVHIYLEKQDHHLPHFSLSLNFFFLRGCRASSIEPSHGLMLHGTRPRSEIKRPRKTNGLSDRSKNFSRDATITRAVWAH